mmetsp:Transcript_45119/g.94636  ORF Transcript_45119/g.94636 Transcript_45119/m.94636 type:complete len:161 (+) Transcript_45119:75-557(+)
MGNRSSSAASASAEGQGGGESAKINSDFDSHILQTEWNKYRALHLQRHQERETSSSLRQAEVQQTMEALQTQAKQVHTKLDEMVDSAKSQLVDLEVEVGHDVTRLEKKFQGSLSGTSAPEGKCLDVRAELSHCYSTLKDTGECQIFVQKLDKCVTEALAS